MITPPLVTTGFQVWIKEGDKQKAVGRKYHVRDAALALVRMYESQGIESVVKEVRQFEGDSKVIK